MKYKTIGAFKSVQNIPYCKAAVDVSVGMGVILDRAAKTASLPGGGVRDVIHIVTNINDVPELGDFTKTTLVPAGEFVRADDLRTVVGLEAEFSASEITDLLTSLAADDTLVFGADGKLVKGDYEGYQIYFKVIGLTSYMDGGVLVEICAGEPAATV
jgi:hypothetical protein